MGALLPLVEPRSSARPEALRFEPSPMQAALPFVLLTLAPAGGFAVLGWRARASRRVLAVVLAVLVALLPWLAPPLPILRFFIAMGAILVCARLLETLRGHVPEPAKSSFASYCTYFLSVAELTFSESDAARSRARRAGGLRLLRALVKAACVLGLFALATAYPALHEHWAVHALWCLFAAYFAASGGADLQSGLVMCSSGHQAGEVFCAPPLATSPRDFWSRRWNAMFRNSAHRLVFTPLGGAAHPVRAVLGVFLASALVHEYLVLASLGHTRGHMFTFFMLHGIGTLLTGLRRTPWPVPRGLDVLLHSAWLVVTAPLFFAPMELIFPIRQWHLW